ncbi:protein CHUP1, chloroplastic isoform X2 [Neltuma alba]|uniref:protein CHUP1, chloroplastic isoform X2 n=1 Tax=Neltuma alba TaxID=207710 RepID=UPI0010A4CDBF|nr:protein CHUP1, chloroplastic isoform X2 [Prosopis alba]
MKEELLRLEDCNMYMKDKGSFFADPILTIRVMKQVTPPPTPPQPLPTTNSTARSVCKPIDTSQQSLTPSRLRAPSKVKDSPKSPETVNGLSSSPSSSSPSPSSSRAKSVPPDMKNNSKAKRALLLNKPKSGEVAVGSQKAKETEEAKVVTARFVNRPAVEQFARPRRRAGDFSLRKNEDDPTGKKALLEKLDLSENLIKNLESEVVALKAELDEVKSLNVELESQNRKLTENLAAAEAKLVAASTREKTSGEHQSTKFKDIQRLIADKLERSKVKKVDTVESVFVKAPIPVPASGCVIPKAASVGRKPPPRPCLAPPPPPPLPPPIPSRPPAKASITQKAPVLVDLYNALKKQEVKKNPRGLGNFHKPVAISAHSSIVGEIQNRSAHLLAIRTDIETKGEFINDLIKKVVDAAYSDIEDVLKFVDWLDGQLSSLADEQAVLKHFNWPERKADALREAAVEYRDLKLLEQEISSFKDDPDIPCGAALKKMASLLDKSERSIQKLIKLRNSVMRSYHDLKIPTAWMLDSGIMSKIKKHSMTLVKMYMKRVTMELESIRNSDRESSQESLLLQGVHFAYRAHQFAGGLDSETLCAFEEIRQRVPGHLAGSRELLAGIPSS